jgi:tetratricopeptide (TPR) repeat protein
MQRFWWGAIALAMAAAMAAPAGAQGRPPMMGGPMMGRMGSDKPGPKTAALMKKADQLEAKYKKNPKDSKLKLQLAQAKYEYGHARMLDNALSPRNKYRPALKAFREALKLNPDHKQAKADKDMIENIYRQMGMPVPQ